MNGHASRIVTCVGCIVGLAAAAAPAQDQDGGKKNPQGPPVAVLVNGDPIYVAELESHYNATANRQRLNPARADRTKAEFLLQLISRRLIAQALERAGSYVEPGEIEKQMEQVAAQIRQQHRVSLEQYAQARGVTVESLKVELFWRFAWDRYLDRHLADALEGHFNKHRKDLDGTEVRASHIVLRPEKYSETQAQIDARAKKIREEIESGKITFEEAARKYSAGPSRAQGGDLGFFPRRGAMAEEFAKVAFALNKGELSQPLTTVFGTHLIRVTDVKPGLRQWTEVIPETKALAAADLFEQFAKQELEKAKIEYTGNTPHFKPGTDELVVPAGAQRAATQ